MPPRLVLLNTEQEVDEPKLAQTTFWFDSHENRYMETFSLHLDQGGHEPTHEEDSLAPFCRDPSQRILALEFHQDIYVFVLKTEVLLELAREHGGAELEWEQWRTHVIEVLLPSDTASLWASGPRLFCLRHAEQWRDEMSWLDVYDFSRRASARHMREVAYDNAGVTRQMGPSVERHRVPWRADTVHLANGGHDSIIFVEVNVPFPTPDQDLTEVLHDRSAIAI